MACVLGPTTVFGFVIARERKLTNKYPATNASAAKPKAMPPIERPPEGLVSIVRLETAAATADAGGTLGEVRRNASSTGSTGTPTACAKARR